MELKGSAKRLRLFLGESDRYDHQSLARALVERARREGLAGATVLRGVEGFGPSQHLHTTRILSLSEDLPLVVEIIDGAKRVEAFLPVVAEMSGEGLVTLEDVEVVFHRRESGAREQ